MGSLVAVYPRFETFYDGLVVDHVHNDYMELLAEMGLLGALCGAAFLWILFRDAKKCFAAEQGHFSRAIHAAATTAICGLLLHGLVDFNLHIPSNILLFLLADPSRDGCTIAVGKRQITPANSVAKTRL